MASKKSKTYLAFVLDESGSMSICRQATINGYNEYLATLHNQDGVESIKASLTKFNTVFNQVYADVELKDVPDLTSDTYQPDGFTALYDAIAHTILALDVIVKKKDRVLCAILTDGAENSSKEYTHKQIFDMIKEREQKGNWTFVYIGANQDAYAVGMSIGVPMANNLNFDVKDTEETYRSFAKATSSYVVSKESRSSSFWK